jgi:integrase
VSHNVGPFIALPPEKKQPKAGRALTAEEARRFLEVVKGDPLEALSVLALTTGMRQGELLALQWSDVDVTLRRLQVQRTLIRVHQGTPVVAAPKSLTSRRSIQLTPLAVTALQNHAQRLGTARQREGCSGRGTVWVFCDAKGIPLRASQMVRQSFQPLVAKAGLPPIRFHDLRHSVATLLLTLDIHPKMVQELLGHSQIGVTLDIYSHTLPSLQEGAMQKLQGLLTASEPRETR